MLFGIERIMADNIRGRRLPDTADGDMPRAFSELRPGDYWKLLDPETGKPLVVDHPDNLTKTAWTVLCPVDPRYQEASGWGYLFASLRMHTVRENTDGTISVLPGDGSSNSILVSGRWNGEIYQWHGYIYNDEFREC